ncbi:exodeoxyribonuclease V subunit beta [Pseudomonas oryzihabitans]|uniref:exodeoxyribonuclease V subunit beta n=1 Tax=Pseudomonas oryzihabitans TaxID=47885 RepID=UPI001F526C04|nr:exodeoxyribonuclease V subunit beta [Pseudomonas oryzihabitans]MCI1010440.1 exodeoxyribonuclease V subunit beta [Pseudomonas oryzihabitans]
MSQRPLALRFPLQGNQLIEASAGTGKTFTISALYVRLVLGHGTPETAFGRELLPPQILVVTFTEAATQELRDRIRHRLAEAARFFRDEIAAPDPLLAELREDFPVEAWADCSRRLDIAAQWMDEAAVSTIHSWCQRMLREHAFDSGSLFVQNLEQDQSELLAQVVRDYWRRFCYPLEGEALDWVIEHWGEPRALAARLRPLLSEALGAPQGEPAALLATALTERRERLAHLKAPWARWAEEVRDLCQAGCDAKVVDGRKLQKRFFGPWCDKLVAWADNPTSEDLDIGTGFTRLTEEGFAEVWTKASPPDHPALAAMARLPGQLAELPSPEVPLLEHAAAWVQQKFEREKLRRAELGFDDILTRLDRALQADGAGARLAALIREQFPVALIDEFQDTDPVQYRIFSSVYGAGEGTGLFLIGDPKQAIYAFRGADIHTYLQARRANAGHLHSLDTNFRSTAAMVAAVNQVFAHGEATAPRAAFLFRHGEDNPVPFEPVRAQGRREVLEIEGTPGAALTFWQLAGDEPLAGTAYRAALAESTASEIVRLLSLAAEAKAGFRREDGELTPLRPADIAILVRAGSEAQAVRQALVRRGVRSVYLSDKDSVFTAQEARCLLDWLKACAEPDVDRRLRAALGSLTLDLPLAELEALNHDEQAWEARVLQFRGYRQLWRGQGVLPMLRRLLQDFRLPQRLMARADGERVLTNLLHLAELLQRAAGELDGEQALIRHLAEQLAAQGAADEQILRLESDAELVKVVTVHKSKGLEYPLVFLPFACAYRAEEGTTLPLRYHDDQGQLRRTFKPSAEELARADDERLAEDLRLLYVALTRARHACWVGVADLKRGRSKESGFARSALGYLATGGEPLASSAALGTALTTLIGAQPDTLILPLPEASPARLPEAREAPVTLKALTARRAAREDWWIASYSALRIGTRLGEAREEGPFNLELDLDTPAAQKLFDDDRLAPDEARQPAAGEDLHRFPRGPGPGTFLHSLLEWVGEEGFTAIQAAPERLDDLIARRCQRRGWNHWIPILQGWLRQLLTLPLPLPGGSQRLGELARYQVEMEFWFATHGVDLERLDDLVSRGTHRGQVRPMLEPGQLNGLFKGFIDLVFEHEGRYFVVDYKSNWLGAEAGAYTRAAMEEAVLAKRYDLQYVLYSLAVHRLLKARLPDYSYERHFGGAVYLFLRGCDPAGHGVFVERPAQALIETLDLLFSGAENAHV